MEVLKNLKIELQYDPALPLLGIYPEKTNLKGYIHPSDYCSTLYSTWKQHKCPSTEEWVKNVVCIYNGLLLNHKKE